MGKNVRSEDLSIRWPFAFTTVRLNRDTSLLKLIAMISMLIDHAGKVLFPQLPFLRLIGRLAFPLYAYCVAVGCVYTRDPLKYMGRLVLLALISQPVYAVALKHTVPAMFKYSFAEQPLRAAWAFYIGSWNHPSVLLSLIAGVALITTLKERRIALFLGTALLCWMLNGYLDYNWRGLALMLLFFMCSNTRWLAIPVITAYMFWWGTQGVGYNVFGMRFGIQMFALAALPLIFINTRSRLRLPKWLTYSFYPVHCALIWAVSEFLMK